MNYTPEQIKLGKKLVIWLVSLGWHKDSARKEVAYLLLRHTTKRIQWASQQICCTNLSNLKKIL